MEESDELIHALEGILADIDNMGDPDTGCLSPGERDELRARRLVDGALDS
jgi:hypothetical protein